MFARRAVREIPELADLVWAAGPASVIERRQPLFGQPEGVTVLVRFGDCVRVDLPEPARAEMVALASTVARRAGQPVDGLLARFASACRSGMPTSPGLVRDAFCVLAADRLDTAVDAAPGDAIAARVAAEELVVAAMWVASAGKISDPAPPSRRRRRWFRR